MLVLFDVLLTAAIVLFASWTLIARELFTSIVVFFSTGLLLALAWARLGAPDIAIAEAAIGAGLTGALLLAAWRRLRTLTAAPGADE